MPELPAWLNGALNFVENHLYAIIGFVGTLVLVLTPIAVILWRLRKERKQQGARPAQGLPKKALVRVWKAFLKQIPREFRRSILLYQPFVVLGESGSGKSLLIGKYTDWAGQAAQFYPSFAADPQLQVYLGSRALVQELPASLLHDTSPRARAALVKLWARTFRRRDPTVVITISAGALRAMTPDSLRMQAQIIRGKINILSRIRRAPVKTRLVLTHMDQVEGYLAFSNFLEQQGIPLELDISRAGEERLEEILVPYEKYLPLALSTLPVKAYTKVLTFLKKAPATFAYLSILLKTLRENDPLSFEPEMKELYLTADTGGSPSALANPFASTLLGLDPAERMAARRKHRIAASAVAAAGLVYLGSGYYRERMRWQDARAAIELFEQSKDAAVAKDVDQRIQHLAGGGGRWSAIDDLLPHFFSRSEEGLRARFLEAIRRNHLTPALEAAMTSGNGHEKVLFLLGLLYATRDDQLGTYVREVEREGDLSRMLGISPDLIAYYLRYSTTPWAEPVRLRPLPYERRASPPYELQPWMAFLIELSDALERPYLTGPQLEKLRASANQLYGLITQVRRHQYAHLIYKTLSRNPNLDLQPSFERFLADLDVPDWIVTNAAQLKDVLLLVRDTGIEVPPTRDTTLAGLVYELNGLRAVAPRAGPVHLVALGGRRFTVDAKRWYAVVESSKVRLLVNNFIHDHQAGGEHGSMLTQTLASAAPGAAEAPGGGTFYPDILLKPANRGDFLFSGRGVIRGPYTRAAYEREVKPVFEQLGPVIDSLKLDPDLQSELSSFVLREIEDYATDYANEALRFYRGWDVKADSLGSLLIILNQMRLPKSSFVEFLQTISETTAIGEATSPYLRPMAEKLEKFQFVNRLLVPDKAALPELDKYRAILGRMAADLEGSPGEEKRAAEEPAAAASAPGQGGPAPAPKVVPVAGDFESSLTPLGRLSLAILQDRRDSYLRLARQWLDSVGIEGDDWRRPFLAPIEQAHKLGKADLEAAVKKNWEERVLPQVLPVLLKFPFNQSAEREATPLEIEEALHPNGTFWRTFRKMIAPLCVEEKASWRPLSGTETGFRWPADLFPVVNHLAKLTATLWGPDGSPRPVDLTVQAQPLPLGRGEPKVLVLSFLSCGRASAFGFNQKPEPVGFAWEWWTSPASNVGVQLGDPETDEKSDRAISIGDSMWSVLRLLKRGQLVERDTWSWSLARGGFEDPYRVKFTIRENPWDLFSVPAYQEIIHEAK